jgi:antitoxin ParD1/3/4
MPAVEKITIALTQELVSLVRQAVESGEYASTSEVIREALRDWEFKRLAQQQQIEEIRRAWQEGISSGSAGVLDVEAMGREARAAAWRDAAKNLPRTPPLSDEAISRESLYDTRG